MDDKVRFRVKSKEKNAYISYAEVDNLEDIPCVEIRFPDGVTVKAKKAFICVDEFTVEGQLKDIDMGNPKYFASVYGVLDLEDIVGFHVIFTRALKNIADYLMKSDPDRVAMGITELVYGVGSAKKAEEVVNILSEYFTGR